MTTSTRETAQVIQQGKDDIEARYRSSLPNQGYVFPRRLSDTSSSDSSLERLEGTEIYNLYTQNYHTSTTNTNASSSDKDTSEETEIENKQIEVNRNTESVKKMGQMKVVSLGPIELLNLYRKTLESYREETEEEPRLTRGNRPESLVISDSNKKYGNLIMKIVKSKRGKEKSLQDLYGTKQKIVANVYAKDSKRAKHQKNVSKETSDFSQDLLNTLKGDMGDEILKGICVTEPVNPTAVPRKSVEKKCNGGAIIQQKTVVKEKEKHVKNKSSAKMINLHAGYQTTGTKQVVRAKTNIQAEAVKKGDAQEVKAQEHGKCVKKVEIVKETGQIREVRDTGRGKNEEKTRETTREKTVEKPAEVKATLRKQVSVGSTQVTERLSTSRSNKPDMASLKRVETLKVNVNKKGNERESIDEKKERKKMVADALAVAKILDMAKTMPIVKLDREEKKNNVKMEEYQEIEVLEPCSSGVFDSPIMYKKMERRKMAVNLHVVTQSVVKEYEAREKRREQTKKKMMEVRKFY